MNNMKYRVLISQDEDGIYVEFDYDNMVATQYSRTKTGAYGKDIDIKLKTFMQDPLSALFYFRKYLSSLPTGPQDVLQIRK